MEDVGGVGVVVVALLGTELLEGFAVGLVFDALCGELGAEVVDEFGDGAGGGVPGVPAEDGGGGEVGELGEGRLGGQGEDGCG